MKLSEHEKLALESLHTLSGVAISDVKEIFLALLFMLAVEFKKGSNTITIPLFGEFKLNFEIIDDTVVEHTYVKLSPLVKSVLDDFSAGRESLVEKHLRGDITRKLAESLSLDASKEYSLLA